MTFLALDFQWTLTPMVHPNIVGESGWTGYFQPTVWEPRGLPFGRQAACPHPFKVFVHLQKETVVFKDPKILIIPILGLHIDFDQLEDEEAP